MHNVSLHLYRHFTIVMVLSITGSCPFCGRCLAMASVIVIIIRGSCPCPLLQLFSNHFTSIIVLIFTMSCIVLCDRCSAIILPVSLSIVLIFTGSCLCPLVDYSTGGSRAVSCALTNFNPVVGGSISQREVGVFLGYYWGSFL
jgi:hypothetical protein